MTLRLYLNHQQDIITSLTLPHTLKRIPRTLSHDFATECAYEVNASKIMQVSFTDVEQITDAFLDSPEDQASQERATRMEEGKPSTNARMSETLGL